MRTIAFLWVCEVVPELTLKPSRGSSNLVQNIGPCQGFELAGRVDYPVTGGKISWHTVTDIDEVLFSYSTSADPQSQSDFTEVISNVTGGWRGQQCIDGPNFSAMGLSAGDEVTLQFAYGGGPNGGQRYEVSAAILTLDRTPF